MSDETKTFQLRYVGSRFNGARLPVEVLSDLPAFKDLLVSYAKDNWRASNVDKKRIPKGFDKSISLDLIAIENGSAMPKLEWNRDIAQVTLPGFEDELETSVKSSFDDFIKLIDDAGRNNFPKVLSSETIRALNKLGSGLKEHEKIEFVGSQGHDGNVVYLDTVRRKDLITHVRETYELRYEGIGELLGSNADGNIEVDTKEYGKFFITVGSERAKEFDGSMYSSVQFSLQIALDNNDKFKNVIGVFDVDLIDTELSDNVLKCKIRLDELRQLPEGWLDGAGKKIDENALSTAEKFLMKRPALADKYRIFPMETGGVLFEFETDGWDLSVEFYSNNSVEIYGVEINGTDELIPQQFSDLDNNFIILFDKYSVRRGAND